MIVCKKIGLLSFLALLISGCATSNTPMMDSTLPRVENVRTLSDISSVAFEWDISKDPRVAGYRIYRSDPKSGDSKPKPLGDRVGDRYTTHYVDRDLAPNSIYYYQLVTIDKEGRESERTAPIQVQTANLEPVVFVQAISNYPRRVKILWRPHDNPRVSGYIIERSDLSKLEFTKIAEIDNRLQAEYIDTDLKDNAVYRYRVLAKTFDNHTSAPSQVVEAKTKPLPQQVQGLVATMNLPKQIRLTWIPNSEPDIKEYVIYRSPYQTYLFMGIARVRGGNEYIDNVNEDGKTYFYKVTAVDKDGLESEMPSFAVVGATLSPPLAPYLTSATIQDNAVVLRWKKSDNRAASFIVVKKTADIFDTKTVRFTNIIDEFFVDRDIIPGVKYLYSVIAVDENGIASSPTKDAELLLPPEVRR